MEHMVKQVSKKATVRLAHSWQRLGLWVVLMWASAASPKRSGDRPTRRDEEQTCTPV